MRKAYLSLPITATMAFLLCADAAVCWQHPCWFRGRIESVLMALWPHPPPGLKLTSRVAFHMYRRLAEEPLCRPSDSCSGSWIINPLTLPPQEPTFVFFVCSHWLGIQRLRRHQCAAHLNVCTFFASPNFLRTRPLPCSGLTSLLNNSAASLFESLGRVSGGRH